MNDKSIVKLAGLFAGLMSLGLAHAAGLSISNTPLYVTQPLPPNVIISPVYTTEYNEVAMRNAPWLELNIDYSGVDNERPRPSFTTVSSGQTSWHSGAPFYLLNPVYGWRVTPWPDTSLVDGKVYSEVSLYPHDKIDVGVVTQFKPLDYISGLDQFPTEEQYPESAVLNSAAAGKARYVRSNLNFLYYNKEVTYSPWPNLGGRTFSSYQNATASTPYYHPTQAMSVNGEVVNNLASTANLAAEGAHPSRHCNSDPDVQCESYSTSGVAHLTGQYWTYQNGKVWNDESYGSTKWTDPGMTDADKVNFAHWFTYWRSSDLAARGMMARLVDELSSSKMDLLRKLRLGIFSRDKTTGVTSMQVQVGSESDVIKNLSDIIYDQDNVYTKESGILVNGKKFTNSIWDPYETVRYFKTEPPYREDPNPDSVNSPLRSCRRNYEIVLTPDYSGLRRDNSDLTVPRSPAGNHDLALGAPYADGFSDTFGDVGAYGWDIDLMDTLDNNLLPTKRDEKKSQHLVRYVIGPTDYGTIFNTPMNSYDAALARLNDPLAPDWVDPAVSELLGPTVIDDLWHMALNSRGFFYGGEDVSKALDKLLQSLNDILVNNVSGSSVATSTTSLSNGGLIYLATVESDWKGHLRAYSITRDDTDPNKPILKIDYTSPKWDLAEKVSAADPLNTRKIATFNGTIGVPFLWGNLSQSTQNALKTDKPATVADEVYGAKIVDYLRGDKTCEEGVNPACSYVDATGTEKSYVFRRRNLERNNQAPYTAANVGGRNVLGDIANSNPWLVSAPQAGPSDVDYPRYNAFRLDKKSRPNVLYVGANDGMLHAVKADDTSAEVSDGGTELFAYVPSFVGNLHELARLSYGHNYYVDGSPFSADVDVGGWKTVLAGGANRGGKGYYLLDVSDPANNTEANSNGWVKWEFTAPDLHYTYNLPMAYPQGHIREGQARQIARMNDGQWALIVGNGYPEEGDKKACLYIIYLSGPGVDHIWGDGVGAGDVYHSDEYHKLCAGSDNYSADGGLGTNGLSTPTPYDTNGDGKVDVIYAGDLNGNMWKFDVSAAAATASSEVTDPDTNEVTTVITNNWAVANSGAPLFVAKNALGVRQPIISPPEVTTFLVGTTYGQLVLFGTGKYIESDDMTNVNVQSFYGVWDRGIPGIVRDDLFSQAYQLDDSITPNIRKQANKQTFAYCATEANPAACQDATQYLGWYWDMDTAGERLTGRVSLINSVILFNTFYPLTEAYDCPTGTCYRLDPCQYGGDGWLMGLNAAYGYMEDQFPVFDVNQDGVIDAQDTKAAGVKIGAAIGGTSFARGIGNTEVGFADPTNKEQSDKTGKTIVDTGGGTGRGRVSWFELID